MNLRAMITLISGQRMQNLIPCFQKGLSIAEVHLIRSHEANDVKSSMARAWEDTKAVLTERKVTVNDTEPSVSAFDIQGTSKVVQNSIDGIRGRGLEPIVNFTGGTKCMAVGAFLASNQSKCVSLYVDTENEQLRWYRANGAVESEPFILQELNIPIYLKAYGLSIAQHGRSDQYRKLSDVLDLVLALCPRSIELLDNWTSQIRDCTSNNKECLLQLPSGNLFMEQFIDGLVRKKMVSPDPKGFRPTKEGSDFLRGDWLELLTYHVLKKDKARFGDIMWQVNLSGVANELDVAAMSGGRFSVIECKSGNPGGQETLNKLQALRERLGLFANMWFVSSLEAKDIPEGFRRRAREYGVKDIITRETLVNASSILTSRKR